MNANLIAQNENIRRNNSIAKHQSDVEINIVCDDSHLPTRQTKGSTGYDLYANIPEQIHTYGDNEITLREVYVSSNGTRCIPTGVKIQIPEGYVGKLHCRSGLAAKHSISVLNGTGIIDSDYRDEIGVILHNHSDTPFIITDGMRIAQLLIEKVIDVKWRQVYSIGLSDERTGGFGSTGI